MGISIQTIEGCRGTRSFSVRHCRGIDMDSISEYRSEWQRKFETLEKNEKGSVKVEELKRLFEKSGTTDADEKMWEIVTKIKLYNCNTKIVSWAEILKAFQEYVKTQPRQGEEQEKTETQ